MRERGDRGDRGDMGDRESFQEGEGRSLLIIGSLSFTGSGDGTLGIGIVGLDLGSNNTDRL